MHLNRTSARVILVSLLLLSASITQAAQTTKFCIDGTGDGSSWDWEVRFYSSTAVEIDRCIGTSTSPSMASASEIRDILVGEINDACGIVVNAVPVDATGATTCLTNPGVHPGFTADGYFDFDLWIEEQDNPGTVSEVGGSSPVDFGAIIFVEFPVPEPSSQLLLSTGILALIGLVRRRFPRQGT